MADIVGVMHDGVIQQCDSPYDIYHRPRNRFIAGFIGQGVLLPGIIHERGRVSIELGMLRGVTAECDGEDVPVRVDDDKVDVLIRPDDILHDDASPMQATVEGKVFHGADFIYRLRLPSGNRVLAQVPSHHNHALGEKIGIRLQVDHVVTFRHQS